MPLQYLDDTQGRPEVPLDHLSLDEHLELLESFAWIFQLGFQEEEFNVVRSRRKWNTIAPWSILFKATIALEGLLPLLVLEAPSSGESVSAPHLICYCDVLKATTVYADGSLGVEFSQQPEKIRSVAPLTGIRERSPRCTSLTPSQAVREGLLLVPQDREGFTRLLDQILLAPTDIGSFLERLPPRIKVEQVDAAS